MPITDDELRLLVERALIDKGWNVSTLVKAAKDAHLTLDRATAQSLLNGNRKSRRQTISTVAKILGISTDELLGEGSKALDENSVMAWLRLQLPGHLGEHIVSQFYILRDASSHAAAHGPPKVAPNPPSEPPANAGSGSPGPAVSRGARSPRSKTKKAQASASDR